MVGVKGFEPPAPCSQSTYATKLRYTPLDPVAVTAVGFAPDDEIYLTIPASICQHLFSIFPKKLLSLSSSLRSAPWLPCVRGAVRRRAGLKRPDSSRFAVFMGATLCFFFQNAHASGSLRSPSELFSPGGRSNQLHPSRPGKPTPGGVGGGRSRPRLKRGQGESETLPYLHSVCGRSNQLHPPKPGKPSPGGVGGGRSRPRLG